MGDSLRCPFCGWTGTARRTESVCEYLPGDGETPSGHGPLARQTDKYECEVCRQVWDAVVEATEHRMRPIMLTAAAASLALIPIAREIFWGPMAYAMMGGIIVGTVLTLLFLPALYVAWFRIKEPEPATDNTHENTLAPELQADRSAEAPAHRELENA